MPDPEREALDAVREHLDEAHAAADRLVREAQRQAEEAGGAGEQVPPRGWDTGRGEAPAAPDLKALLVCYLAIEGLRSMNLFDSDVLSQDERRLLVSSLLEIAG